VTVATEASFGLTMVPNASGDVGEIEIGWMTVALPEALVDELFWAWATEAIALTAPTPMASLRTVFMGVVSRSSWLPPRRHSGLMPQLTLD
jgi:hypothetical protein